MAKPRIAGKFALLAKLCSYQIIRFFLLKNLKVSFFDSFRADPQQTLNTVAASLTKSKDPAWSMQLLELLTSVPNKDLEANRVVVMLFKSSPEDKTPAIDYLLKAQSVLMACFSIRSLEVERSLVHTSDVISFINPSQRVVPVAEPVVSLRQQLVIRTERVVKDGEPVHQITEPVMGYGGKLS